jgi:plasmid stabilization system protein ParE
MSDYDLTPLAKADIFAIWAFIAEDNEVAADRVQHAIYDACTFLAESPLRQTSEIRSGNFHQIGTNLTVENRSFVEEELGGDQPLLSRGLQFDQFARLRFDICPAHMQRVQVFVVSWIH